MPHFAALPFTLRRSSEVIAHGSITSTTETVHGLLRLEEEELRIQWRVARKIDRIGGEIRTDQEFDGVRDVSIPLEAVAGAKVRSSWWRRLGAPVLVLTAGDLRAFETLTGPEGLSLAHPAELVLRLPRGSRLAAEEFAAELELTLAERGLAAGRGTEVLGRTDGGDQGGGAGGTLSGPAEGPADSPRP